MSLELIGGVIQTGSDDPPAEVTRAITRRTRFIALPNRIVGLCRMPNGKTAFASASLAPIRKQMAPKFVAAMQNRPGGWGWGSIKGTFKAAVKVKGIAKVARLVTKAAVKIQPFVGSVPVLGNVTSGLAGADAIISAGIKLKGAARAAHPKVHATIDAAAKGDATARATIRAVHSKARSDPRAAKALAQLRIVNKVRTAEAVESVVRLKAVARAAALRARGRMPPAKAAHVARRLDDVTKRAAALAIPATAAMRTLEPDASRRAWIFQLCGRIQQAPAVAMTCPPSGGAVAGRGMWSSIAERTKGRRIMSPEKWAWVRRRARALVDGGMDSFPAMRQASRDYDARHRGAAAGAFLGTGAMTPPTGTGFFAWLGRAYLAGIR